jgi:hypothetical protein
MKYILVGEAALWGGSDGVEGGSKGVMAATGARLLASVIPEHLWGLCGGAGVMGRAWGWVPADPGSRIPPRGRAGRA